MRPRQATNVSVVMTARNAQETIHAAATSILHAMGPESELLILLDQCTDNTQLVLQRISDVRIRVFESEANLGVAKGRNFLVGKARQEIIAIADADDVYFPWRIRKGVSALIRGEVDFNFQNAILFGRSSDRKFVIPQRPVKLEPSEANIVLGLKNPFVHSSATFRKQVFERLGGYREVPSEDYDLWLRASQSGFRLSKTRTFSLGYRVHQNQLSQNKNWRQSVATDPNLNRLIEKQRAIYPPKENESGNSLLHGIIDSVISWTATRLGLNTDPERK
jgi:glycosyltransferase involved in cell wall biosynthesis